MGDPYLRRDGTLRNRLGIADAGRLQVVEAQWCHLRAQALRRGEPDALGAIAPGWGLDRLKALHALLFGDVYDWAGTTRAEPFIDRASGAMVRTGFGIRKTGMGKAFAAPGDIAGRMARLEDRIGDVSHLAKSKRIDLAVFVADVLGEVNAIHPFREGNGRTQRAFARGIANAAGRDIAFGAITGRRMARASEASMDGDPDAMRRLVRDAMSTERRRGLDDVRAAYAASGVDWNDMYVACAEPGHEDRGGLVAWWGTPPRFQARATSGVGGGPVIVVGRVADLAGPHGWDGGDGYGTPVAYRARGKPTPRPPWPAYGRGR